MLSQTGAGGISWHAPQQLPHRTHLWPATLGANKGRPTSCFRGAASSLHSQHGHTRRTQHRPWASTHASTATSTTLASQHREQQQRHHEAPSQGEQEQNNNALLAQAPAPSYYQCELLRRCFARQLLGQLVQVGWVSDTQLMEGVHRWGVGLKSKMVQFRCRVCLMYGI